MVFPAAITSAVSVLSVFHRKECLFLFSWKIGAKGRRMCHYVVCKRKEEIVKKLVQTSYFLLYDKLVTMIMMNHLGILFFYRSSTASEITMGSNDLILQKMGRSLLISLLPSNFSRRLHFVTFLTQSLFLKSFFFVGKNGVHVVSRYCCCREWCPFPLSQKI